MFAPRAGDIAALYINSFLSLRPAGQGLHSGILRGNRARRMLKREATCEMRIGIYCDRGEPSAGIIRVEW